MKELNNKSVTSFPSKMTSNNSSPSRKMIGKLVRVTLEVKIFVGSDEVEQRRDEFKDYDDDLDRYELIARIRACKDSGDIKYYNCIGVQEVYE